jgi:heavy metal translocating P-type ATPase
MKKLIHFIVRFFGADLIAVISIVTALWLHQWLAAGIIVLMLSGGRWLESLASRRASRVLDALARRMPQTAHRKRGSELETMAVTDIQVGDTLVILPQEICPVDGVVLEGYGGMDESFLTGEPFEMQKAPGSRVLSGAINRDTALVIRAEKLAKDSRYAKIMQVMQAAEKDRPELQRIGDRLGAAYAPLALVIAGLVWWQTGSAVRFLSVLLIATPCPLLIAIPIAVVGAISLAAKRSIIIKTPAILEQLSTCEVILFDKTGTLTYGRPQLTEVLPVPGFDENQIIRWAASAERYSKHPLAHAIVTAAGSRNLSLSAITDLSEKPGKGLMAHVDAHAIQITGRKHVAAELPLPPVQSGLECLVFVDGVFAAALRFHDAPRRESRSFISHLPKHHRIRRVLLLSGDREAEVRYLADAVGIQEVQAGMSPEEKVEVVRKITETARTIFVGDGINDAPALMTATVGIALGQNSDVTSEAADAVVLDVSLTKVDELLHIGRRMRIIALQSALGGMALSLIGMGFASAGLLSPVAAAIVQEAIDLIAVLNATRVAIAPRVLSDCCP